MKKVANATFFVKTAGLSSAYDLVDVGESEDLAEAELDAGDLDLGLADALGTAQDLEVEAFGFLASELFGGEADDRFGDAAGRAVDDAGAAFEAHRVIAGLVGQAVEVDAELADEVGEFRGRHRDVDVADAVVRELLAGDLEFLGRAGHDGDDEDVLVVLADFLGKDAAEDGRAHFLRGLAAREVTEHVLLVFLSVLDPRGAARGEDGEVFALGDAAEALGAFLDRGEVGGERHVAHEVGFVFLATFRFIP